MRQVTGRAKLPQRERDGGIPRAAQLLVGGNQRFQMTAQLGAQLLPPSVGNQPG
jgi:hypothetical protein